MSTFTNNQIAVILVVAMLTFALAGCNNVEFSDSTAPQNAKAGVDTDGDGIVNQQDTDIDGDNVINEEDDDMDGDDVENDEDADCDGDGVENEDDDSPEGEIEDENDEDDDVCIGNGIKVPESAVVACTSGSDGECLSVCINGETSVISFHEARGPISSGEAVAGACVQ